MTILKKTLETAIQEEKEYYKEKGKKQFWKDLTTQIIKYFIIFMLILYIITRPFYYEYQTQKYNVEQSKTLNQQIKKCTENTNPTFIKTCYDAKIKFNIKRYIQKETYTGQTTTQ